MKFKQQELKQEKEYYKISHLPNTGKCEEELWKTEDTYMQSYKTEENEASNRKWNEKRKKIARKSAAKYRYT